MMSEGELFTQQHLLADIAQASTAGLDLKLCKDDPQDCQKACKDNPTDCQKRKQTVKTYQLYKPSKKYVFCVKDPNGQGETVAIEAPGPTKSPPELAPNPDDRCGKGKRSYVLLLRSAQQMFYALGRAVDNPESSEFASLKFHIYNYPPPNVRFKVQYRGQTYFVREYDQNEDHTLLILALLSDLLNLSRDANEIPSTKTVATTP